MYMLSTASKYDVKPTENVENPLQTYKIFPGVADTQLHYRESVFAYDKSERQSKH